MLGDNIMALRKKRGLSQQELADRLHVVRQTISKWEKNLSVPDAEALTKLAEALEVPVPELLGEKVPEDAAPSDLAEVLGRINGQLAVQNRRRSRVWKTVAWVLGVLAALQLLVLVLGCAYSADTSVAPSEHSVVQEQVEAVE